MNPLRKDEPHYIVVGPGERLDAALYDWSWASLSPTDAAAVRFKPAVVSAAAYPRTISEGPGYQLTPDGRQLVPDELPPMEYRDDGAGTVVKSEGASVSGFPANGTAQIPATTKATLLIDRKTLVTAYPELFFSGGRGARVRIGYQEALLEPEKPWRKGHRDVFEGKRFVGYQDEVLPDGGSSRVFHPLWWRTWRYMKIDVETAAEPLTLDRLTVSLHRVPFEETRPLRRRRTRRCKRVWEVGWRTARACAHETYFDCPYYEQLQYVGDTRIQALISYTVAGDDRLARQAIEAFDHSRRSDGLTYSRYPSAPQQFIPPFSLLWIGMVHDYWMWRDRHGVRPAAARRDADGARLVHRAAAGRRARRPAAVVELRRLDRRFRGRRAAAGRGRRLRAGLAAARARLARSRRARGRARRAGAGRALPQAAQTIVDSARRLAWH